MPNENGETRHKNGNTRVDTLRRTYGDDFARGVRGDMKLENLPAGFLLAVVLLLWQIHLA